MREDWWNALRPPEPVRSALKPPLTAKQWKSFVLTKLPFLSWLWMYQLKWLLADLISGITVAIMHIPQGREISDIVHTCIRVYIIQYTSTVYVHIPVN